MNAFWVDIESRFSKLHNEQFSTRRGNHPLVAFDNGDGTWTLSGSTHAIQKSFERIAKQSALRLGAPVEKNLLWFWLDLLKRDGSYFHAMSSSGTRRKSELDTALTCSIEYESSSSTGGVIELPCKASAEYCLECDTREQLEPRQLTAQTSQQTTVALPTTWGELRSRGSISQKEAAILLCCDPKTVRRRAKNKQLKRSTKGRIACDDLLRIEIRKVHGQHVLR